MLACLGITGASKSTPTADMETMLYLGEVTMGAHRLKCGGYYTSVAIFNHIRISIISNNKLNILQFRI